MFIGQGSRYGFFFFFSSRRRHTRCLSDWSSDVCSSDLWAGTARKALPWVVAAAVAGLLAWASPQIFWKAAVVLGVFMLIAVAVGRVVSALQSRGGRRASSLVSGLGSGVALAGLLVFVL